MQYKRLPFRRLLNGFFQKFLSAAAFCGCLAFNADASVFTSGELRHEMFNGATRPQVESGAVTAPSSLEYVASFQFTDVGDNYSRRVSGFFIPPSTGDYVFFVSSDDDSDLFLSTDENPTNKRLVAQETGWSNALQWTSSAGGSNVDQKRSDKFKPAGSTNTPFASGIHLISGTKYYIEGVHHEGGGGDNFAATFKLVADADPADGTDSALTGNAIGANKPDSVTLVTQPFSRRLLPGASVTFSTVADPPTATFQWFKNGAAITGETASTLTTTVAAGDNGATFYAVATDAGNSVQSSNAVVTIGQTVFLPSNVRREFWDDDALTRPDVEDPGFSTAPDFTDAFPIFETPTDQGENYVERVSGLFVPPTTGNYVFFIAADDQGDLFLSTDATPANKRLIAQETGWSSARNWTAADGAGTDLTVAQSAAQKRSDKFIPDPVNDPSATAPFASGINLTAGSSYYIEAVHEEGGGGDNLAVTYKLVGQPDPAPGEISKIVGSLLGPWATTLNGAVINVTAPPTNMTGLQSRTVTFNVGATSGYAGDTSGAGPTLFYQWQTAPAGSSTFTNIPGATATSLTTPVLTLADAGKQFRVVVTGADATTNSAIASLNVTPDVIAPRPVTVTGVSAGRTNITLTFDELLDVASAQTAANFSFAPGNVAGASAVLDSTGTNLTINTATALTPDVENTLTITGLKDLAGNPVAANTTIKFTFNLVTYAANILFDQPVAYYRFEETSGSVATNSGSLGGDGVYSIGDESAPMAGSDTPGEAKGDAGPRPPQFAGFDAQNHGATFDGVGDWVDTKNQFLQGRSAFSLEYWVKPHRTNEVDGTVWPNRVALVGQNDAIEYGFITPGTIQIWTAGGGSLDTPYPYPDDEWHHVATIADGTNIKTYFDGNLIGTGGSATANYGTAGFNVHIGGGGGFDATANWFTGQMDEVAVFDKAIPAARIAAHYKAGKEGGVITVSGAVTPPETGGGGPELTILQTGHGTILTIAWTPAGGTLQTAPALGGAWTNVGTQNPSTINATIQAQFFRVLR